MNVHMNAFQTTEEARDGEIPLQTLKKYLAYVKRWDIVLIKGLSSSLGLFLSYY